MNGTAVLTESFVLEWLSATLAAAEAEEVCLLHALNSECVRAFARSDTSWCRAYLSDDFVCTLADGRRRDKAWFLRQTTERHTSEKVTCDEVDVRAFGKIGLVHGVAHSGAAGSLTSTRFTHVWLVREGRWQLVAAHLTCVAAKPSLQIV